MPSRFTVVLPLVTLIACAGISPAGVAVTGQWGGTHIGLTQSATGGTIEYDCASGTIGAILPGSDGRFEAPGTHTPGQGGPEIEGVVMPTHRVRFTGRVRGETMSLTGRVENGVLLGPFALRRGAEPGIFRCL